MESLTAVRGGHDRSRTGTPALDHAIDRVRVQVRPVREDDDRRFGLLGSLLQSAL